MNIWCWIIPLLVGLICAILGYLLGLSKSKESTAVISEAAEEYDAQADLGDCKEKLAAALLEVETLKQEKKIALNDLNVAKVTSEVSSKSEEVSSLVYDAAAAKLALEKVSKPMI